MDLQAAVEQLREWRRAYYNDQPLVSDEEYDLKEAEVVRALLRHDPKHAFLSEVGFAPEEGSIWPKYKHTAVMGSLDKASSDNTKPEFEAWHRRDGGKGSPLHLSEKIDGCTVVGVWRQGKLVTLATRGNGLIGSNITANAPHYRNIPHELPVKADFILRGEAGIRVSDFEQHGSGFKNPRNATSGKLNDTGEDALKRCVTVWWFEIVETTVEIFLPTWESQFDFIANTLKLPTPNAWSVTPKEMWDVYDRYVEKDRAALDYWIDGLVVRVNDLQRYNDLGMTSKKPKGAIALKFPARGVETTIRGVEVDQGLQNRFTPVALLEPVEIDGTTVGRASLHNYDFIDRMSLQIGDTVEVIKGGDIIPKIVRLVEPGKNRQPIVPPSACVSCDESLVRNGAYLECQNDACPGRTYGDLMKWVRVADIKGIGPAKLQELIEAGITTPLALHHASQSLLVDAVNSKPIGSKIYRSLRGKSKLPLEVVLAGLNVPGLGRTAGGWLADAFGTLDAVLAATAEDLRKLDGIAETADSIVDGLAQKKSLLLELRNVITIVEASSDSADGPLAGSSFCITGKLTSGRKKQEVYDWISAHGGEIKSGVSKDLTYLITADPSSNSSKAQKARKYGIKLVTEDQVYEMVPADQRVTIADPEQATEKSLF